MTVLVADAAVTDPAASLALAVVSILVLVGVVVLIPWVRAQIVATRDAVIDPTGRTVAESAAGVEVQVKALSGEVAGLRSELAANAARTGRAEQWLAGVDDRVTGLSTRVGVVEQATARAHQRIDSLATIGGSHAPQ